MTCKLRKLLALCLCLILLPTWASAMSWSNFVEEAQKLQTAAGNGQAVIDKDSLKLGDGETIGAAGPGYEYLELLNALISGLTFDGTLFLTDGVYVLEGVKVNASGNSTEGIAIVNSKNGTVALVIDATSQIGTAQDPLSDYGIVAFMNGGELILENHADIYASAGIFVNNRGNSEDDIAANIYNSGAIEAEYYGITGNVNGQNANLLIENDGDIKSGYIGIGAYAYVEKDASIKLINSGTIEAEEGGITLNLYGQNAILLIENDGDITAYDGIYAVAGAEKDASVELINSGTIEAEDRGAVLAAYAGNSADISVANDGQIAASDGTGLFFNVDDPDNTNLSLTGTGAIAGAEIDFSDAPYYLNVYKQNANGDWELQTNPLYPADILVRFWGDGLSAEERAALATQLVNGSGILTYQNGYAMVRIGSEAIPSAAPFSVNEEPETGIHLYVFETQREEPTQPPVEPTPPPVEPTPPPVEPTPPPVEPTPPPVEPTPPPVEPTDPPVEPTEPPAEKKAWKHDRFGGITYSLEWLWQAWLVNGSRGLRVYLSERDEQGLLEQGKQLLFKENVSKGPDGNKMLTLTVNKMYTGSMLTCMSMETLRLLLKWGITHLQIVSGDGEGGFYTDTYPLTELLAALESQGYGDCQELWLNGMDGDAVIINANGEKEAL